MVQCTRRHPADLHRGNVYERLGNAEVQEAITSTRTLVVGKAIIDPVSVC